MKNKKLRHVAIKEEKLVFTTWYKQRMYQGVLSRSYEDGNSYDQ